jgi:TolA-binding protein
LDAGEFARARSVAQAALDQTNEPEMTGELHFVLGSAYLLEMEKGAVPAKLETCGRVREHLQQAQQLGVSKSNQGKLAYRLALAEHHGGADVAVVITAVEKALLLPGAERVDGYRLLTALHLQKQPADLEAALRANEKLLAQPHLLDPNPFRLQRGELLLKLGRRDEARAILARITKEAPEFFAARHLRAQSAFEDERWQEALNLWQDTIREDKEDSRQGRAARLYLGLCLAHLQRRNDALAAWEGLRKLAPDSNETSAAGFYAADAHLAAGEDQAALASFAAALAPIDTRQPNPYLDQPAMRRMIEDAWSRWFDARKYELARDLAEHYHSLASPGEATIRFARASEALAQAKQQKVDRTASPVTDELQQQALDHFKQAGDAYEQVARLRAAQPDSASHYWSAADCFLKAQEYQRVILLLEPLATHQQLGSRKLDAMTCLAEAYQALGNPKRALSLLQEVQAQSDGSQPRPRYLLALTYVDLERYAEAEQSLRELLASANSTNDPPEVRQACFALAYVLYKREHFAASAGLFTEALERYPGHGQALQARYWLADALRQSAWIDRDHAKQADTQAARGFHDKRGQNALEGALAHYNYVAAEFGDRQAVRPLKREQLSMLRESLFGIGECLRALGRHKEAIEIYDKLAASASGQTDGLMALLQLAQCHVDLKQPDQARQCLDRCRAALAQLEPKDVIPPQPTREQWLEWIDAVARTCKAN